MKNNQFELNSWRKVLESLLLLASRWLSILPNFSAVGTYGFFGNNFIGFFLSVVVFDWLSSGFYKGFIFTYLGFLGYFVLGKIAANLSKEKSGSRFYLMLLPVASFWFFFISNFGVWLLWYPLTWQGLLSCYLAALPFYRNTLLGDLFFGGLVFVWKELLHHHPKFVNSKLKSPIIHHST